MGGLSSSDRGHDERRAILARGDGIGPVRKRADESLAGGIQIVEPVCKAAGHELVDLRVPVFERSELHFQVVLRGRGGVLCDRTVAEGGGDFLKTRRLPPQKRRPADVIRNTAGLPPRSETFSGVRA